MEESTFYIRDNDTTAKQNLSETVLSTGEHYPYALINPATKQVVLITTRQKFIWDLLVRPQQLKSLVLACFDHYQIFAADEIREILGEWLKQGFIKSSAQIGQPTQAPKKHLIELKNFDQFANKLYKVIGQYLFSKLAIIFIVVASTLGVGIFIASLFSTGYEGTKLNILMLLGTAWISTILHEMGHVITAKHYQSEVQSAGFKFIWGLPVFYVDTTAMWLKPKRERINVSMGGVFVNWIITAVCSYFLLLDPHNQLIAHIQFINFIAVLFNLIPYFGFDGYFLLIDLIDMPNLQNTTREILAGKDMRRLNAHQLRIARIYAFSSLIVTVLLLLFAIYTWLKTFSAIF